MPFCIWPIFATLCIATSIPMSPPSALNVISSFWIISFDFPIAFSLWFLLYYIMKPVLGPFSFLELRLIDTASLATQTTVIFYHLFLKKSYIWTAYLPLKSSYGNQCAYAFALIYLLSLLAFLSSCFYRPLPWITLAILFFTFLLLLVDWYHVDPLRSYLLGSLSSVILALGTFVLFLIRLFLRNLLG